MYYSFMSGQNISVGMKVWGVVSEVNEKDLVISLPGGLRGLVRSSEAFDPVLDNENKAVADSLLPSVFHTGQLVSCIVLKLDEDNKEKEKRNIWLSLHLSLLHKGFTLESVQEGMVLTAYVKSIEDHDSKEIQVKTGQLLQGVVKSVDKIGKVVYLISDQETVSKSVTKDLKGISIDLLVPGMMVNARVLSTLENGVMLSFITYFTGTVNARILFIDPSTRAVGLTLNPHLVHSKAPTSGVKIGDICDASKVVRVDRGLGLLLEIPCTPVPTPAYVSISDVAEEDARKLEKKFKQGSRVRVRILGFRHLEGLSTGTLKSSAMEGTVFTHSDVKPGMVVRGKVTAVDSFGAIVQFPGGIGAELLFRVLGCKSKRITVTHKKTLVCDIFVLNFESTIFFIGWLSISLDALHTLWISLQPSPTLNSRELPH
ncbi:hypothetical protein DVH24_019381 [Malus domestica]|uniref:S1 motif domain-containing protein n=1 Tax=Malus domestica TaxID=3750 RepID=A0A498I5W0_MALDO|nr:hypothetical protein DVH24_019381 [Malus domestica]